MIIIKGKTRIYKIQTVNTGNKKIRQTYTERPTNKQTDINIFSISFLYVTGLKHNFRKIPMDLDLSLIKYNFNVSY